MMQAPVSRAEAREQGLKYYYTGKPCKNGHVAKRLVSSPACVECVKLNKQRFDEKHPKKGSEYSRKWKAKNVERQRIYQRLYDDGRIEYRRIRDKNRKAYHCAMQTARDARKLKATPLWADPIAILSVYAEAERLTNETGIKYHVDHIVPLRGRYACGLHVENNLRPLPALANHSKGNKFAPHTFTTEELERVAERLAQLTIT